MTPEILQLLEAKVSVKEDKEEEDKKEYASSSYYSDEYVCNSMDAVVTKMLKTVYLQTDRDFIQDSENPENGSTATTVLMLGNRLYCANVGDSRTLLCRLRSRSHIYMQIL